MDSKSEYYGCLEIGERSEATFLFTEDEFKMGATDLKIKAIAKNAKNKEDEVEKVGLQREVGLGSAIGLIVGIMIGSGIFVSPGGLFEKTGSVFLSLSVWIGCAILSMLGAIIYIELGTVVPSSGGEYAYLSAAFGPIPGYLFAWMSTIVLKPAGFAILSLAFAQYSIVPFLPLIGLNSESINGAELKWAVVLISAATIMIITYINCASVSLAMNVQNYFTTAKLIAMAIIIGAGIYNLCSGNFGLLDSGFQGSKWEYGALASSFYNGLWAYDGWNSLNYITEELKNPYRNLPLAITIALPVTAISYLLVNIAYFTVITADEMINQPVAIIFGDKMLGVMSWLMPLAVSISTFAAANGGQFTAGRLCYVAAREGHLVECLSYINVKRNTPTLAMIFNAGIAISMTIFLNIEGLINFFSFSAWIFYGVTFAAVIRLRFTKPDAPRPFKVPMIVPIIVTLASIFLVVAPIVDSPKFEYLYASGFLLLGLIIYFPFCHYKIVVPGMERLSRCLQVIFVAAPPERCTDVCMPNPSINGTTKKLT